MPVTEHEVLEAKRLRNSAHEVFNSQKAVVKADLQAAGVGTRIKNRAAEEGKHLANFAAEEGKNLASRAAEEGKHFADEASDFAAAHPEAVKAGAAALGAWFIGKPLLGALISGVAGVVGTAASVVGFGSSSNDDEYDDDDDYDRNEA